MKRGIFATLLVACVCPATFAGDPVFGLKGGLNLASIQTTGAEGLPADSRLGAAIGMYVELPLTYRPCVSLREELMYVMKGASWSSADVEETLVTDEVIFAPSLVLRIPFGSIAPFVEAGPEFGSCFAHDLKLNFDDFRQSFDMGNEWAATNFSVNIGAGFAMRFGQGEMTVSARHNMGFSNMYTGPGGGKARTNGILVLFGYSFAPVWR